MTKLFFCGLCFILRKKKETMQTDDLNEVMREFEQKKHCHSIYEAYPSGRREAEAMLQKFKRSGTVKKSWKRACGCLKTTDMSKYHNSGEDKVLAYN